MTWPTDEAREAVRQALTMTVEDVHVVIVDRDGTTSGGTSVGIDAEGFADAVLAALAPHVAAREAREFAQGERAALAERDQLRAEVAELEKPHQCSYSGMTVAACREAICDCLGGSTWPQRTMEVEREARAALAERDALRATVARVERALDDEEANLADDGARLSHAVVRRLRAVLAGGQDADAEERADG